MRYRNSVVDTVAATGTRSWQWGKGETCNASRRIWVVRSNAGGKLYACKATVDIFHLSQNDFVSAVDRVLTVGDFYDLSAGGQIIFT